MSNQSQVFQTILTKAKQQGETVVHGRANDWFRNKAKQVKKSQTNNIMKDAGEYKTAMYPGSMYMFYYDPKWKDELEHYDIWPLIFPLKIESDRILGMNFHYLQPTLRAKLFDALWPYTNNTKMDATTKMKITYDILKGFSRFNLVKPTIHVYLKKHIRSRFVRIEPYEWEYALLLPTDRFMKETRTTVWKKSRIKAGLKG